MFIIRIYYFTVDMWSGLL